MTSFALIGDSQAAGLLGPGGLATKLSIPFADPRVGWTTGRIAGEPFERALASSAEVILVVTGGNDDPVNTAALLEMVERTRRAGKRLIVVGPVFALTDDAARHDRARAQLRGILIAVNRTSPGVVSFIDAYPMTRDLARTTNVHLTADGYTRYARRLATAVQGGGGLLAWGLLAFAVAYAVTGSARRAAWAAVLPP